MGENGSSSAFGRITLPVGRRRFETLLCLRTLRRDYILNLIEVERDMMKAHIMVSEEEAKGGLRVKYVCLGSRK